MVLINFLGTGQAVPTETRNHTAILLSYKNEKILIDCGEGTQRQFRKAKINPCKLTRILITHWHGDHVLGLPGLFQTLALNNYQKTLYIYGPKGTKKFISLLYKLFIPNKKLKIKIQEVSTKVFENPDFKISAIALEHDIPCLGFSFEEKDKLRIKKDKLNSLLKKLKIKEKDHELVKLHDLIKKKNIKIKNHLLKYKDLTYLQKGKKISLILDTRICNNAKKIAKNSDLTVIESTYAKESSDLAQKYKHLTSEQAAQIAKSSKSKQLIITHISQRYEFKENILLKDAKKIFQNTLLAKDLMSVEV